MLYCLCSIGGNLQKLFFCLVTTLIFGLTLPAWAGRLPACPECPSNCVPDAYVDIQKTPLPENLPECPSGCIPLGSVKLMLDEPACQITTNETQPQKTTSSRKKPTKKKEKRNVESTRHRLIFNPSAVGLKKGEATITGYIAAAWDFEYGFHENLQAGVVTVLPISIIGIIPTVKFHGAVTDYLHLSIGGFGGCLLSYAGSGGSVFLGGGQGVASFVSGKHLINISFSAMSAGVSTEYGWYGAEEALLVPSLGYRLEMHRNWSFSNRIESPSDRESKKAGKRGLLATELRRSRPRRPVFRRSRLHYATREKLFRPCVEILPSGYPIFFSGIPFLTYRDLRSGSFSIFHPT